MNETKGKGVVSVYCCGGTGINIGSAYQTNHTGKDGFATLKFTYADTSASNFRQAGAINSDSVFLLPKENTDGSGKVRKTNVNEIADSIKNLLVKHQPSSFNIVVFAAGGGSGSVFGPLILQELASRDPSIPAVAIVVGSADSSRVLENVINTLKSLDRIVQDTGAPIILYWVQNTPGESRKDADAKIFTALTSLSLLASGQNHGLDTADLTNWVGYHKSTSIGAQVSQLTIVAGKDSESSSIINSIPAPIGVASLYRSTDSPMLKIPCEYNADGYMPAGVPFDTDMHFIIDIDSVERIFKSLNQQLEAQKEIAASRSKIRAIDSKNAEVSSHGLVL
jgi:hypothetical protein